MASKEQVNDGTVSRSASMFELEPNPFEQSFASTKKSRSVSAAVSNSQDQRFGGNVSRATSSGERGSKLTISEITSGSRELDVSSQRRSSVFSYGAQKPVLHSPPLLTPGGSRRLPPILLSPNFIQQAPNASSLVGQGQMNTVGSNYSNMSPKNELPSVSSGGINHINLERPPLNISLSKTAFTPNESHLRTGLTPGVPTAAHQMGSTHYPGHTLPYLGGPRNDIGIHEDTRNPVSYGMNMALNADLSNQAQSYAPGLGPTLGYASSQGFQRTTNPLQRNPIPPAGSARMPLTEVSSSKHSAQIENFAADSINSTTKSQQSRPFGSNSPPSTTARRKRKSSTTSRGSKSSKSSQRNTPTSTECKNLSRKETNDSADRDSDDSQERKRREFLERNRVAASKFRKRKKEYIKRVEMDLKFYEAEYDDLSHAMNRLCGIINGSTSPTSPTPLLGMLETAISKNDTPSSLSILAHIKRVLFQTNYYQRKGRNPRREMEYPQDSDDDRQRTDKELSSSRNGSIPGMQSAANSSRTPGNAISGTVPASYITDGPPPTQSAGAGSNNSILTDNTSVPSLAKEEDPVAGSFPLDGDKSVSTTSTVPSAIGTINTLPAVINGRPVIPLNDIATHSTSNPNTMSEIRQGSLVNLTADVVNAEPISFKYPNSD